MRLGLVDLSDLETFQDLCRTAYTQHFGNHWEEGGLEEYLEDQFGTEVLKKYFNSDLIEFYFIYEEDLPVGFIKLNYQGRLKNFKDLYSCELEKMYILKDHLRKGLGRIAMNKVIDILGKKGVELFFLCVIDTNQRAIEFYKSMGFNFYEKLRLDIPLFKDELRGMDRMVMEL